MSISDTLIGINSAALNTPLNHIIWLSDYKTYGKDSYVFQNKDILHELYENYTLSMNDKSVSEEAFNYAIEKQKIGNAISCIYGVDQSFAWDSVRSVEDLVSNENISKVFLDQAALKTCFLNFTKNEAIMNAICNNKNCLSVLYDNYSDFTDIFANSPFLLSACKASSLYEVVTKTQNISQTDASARITLYDNKCFVLGMSQTGRNASTYSSIVDTLNGSQSTTQDKNYGTTGLVWRINKFASSAKCHPSINYNDIYGISAPIYMAILKIA